MQKWFGEFIAHAGLLFGAPRGIFVGPISEGGSLALGFLGVIWNVCTWELDLGLLLLRKVGGGRVGGEGVEEVLFVLLVDGSWKRDKTGKDVVAYCKSLLGGWRKKSW